MKKSIYYLIILAMILSLSGCGNNSVNKEASESMDSDKTAGTQKNSSPEEASDSIDGIDVDLTQLSSTMVYSEVYNMMVTPEDYIGKTIKMKGQFAVYQNEETNNLYYAVIIADATACCSQGLEFIWKGDHSYPNDYPESGKEITVVGEFQTYEENGVQYCHLIDADIS